MRYLLPQAQHYFKAALRTHSAVSDDVLTPRCLQTKC